MNTIVSDTTTLIVLSKLDRYDLLKNVFEKVFIPKAVITELSKKPDGISEKILECSFFQIKEISDRRLFTLLSDMLDEGESEAIVLSKEMKLMLLIDEKKGRKIAKSMNIKIIGLLGVLIVNVKKGFLSQSEAIGILKQIKELKFRVAKRLEDSFLKQLS
jgi:predicted nucleic acid-binding protein